VGSAGQRGGGATPARAGAWGMGRVGRAGSVACGGEERRLGRIRPNRGGIFLFLFIFFFLFFYFYFYFFYLLFLLNKYLAIFS
jgi:hypothetical protein